LVIATSAAAVTTTVFVWLLLAGCGSVVPAGAVTVAVEGQVEPGEEDRPLLVHGRGVVLPAPILVGHVVLVGQGCRFETSHETCSFTEVSGQSPPGTSAWYAGGRMDWSRDGRFVLFKTSPGTWVQSLADGPSSRMLLGEGTGKASSNAEVSPDGRWVAYQLNWIRQRQEFRQTHILGGEFVTFQVEEEPRLAPWSLRLFGERSESLGMLIVQESQFARGRELFPEAYWVVRYGE
jgi:uncharacterized protein YceK